MTDKRILQYDWGKIASNFKILDSNVHSCVMTIYWYFYHFFTPRQKLSINIVLSLPYNQKKIGKKLLNIFRNLFLHYISCAAIWILNFKNCSKLNAKCWRHIRSIYHPKPRSKNHPWSIVTLSINVWPSSLWLLSLPL